MIRALLFALLVATGVHAANKPAVTGVLNVNRATEAELMLLPGIGKGRAEAIVARRTQKPFANFDDLARMKRMRKVVQKLRAHLSFSGDSTLHPLETAPPNP